MEEELAMGLQRKVGSGIYTQALQSYQGGPCSFGGVGWDHVALAEKGEEDHKALVE